MFDASSPLTAPVLSAGLTLREIVGIADLVKEDQVIRMIAPLSRKIDELAQDKDLSAFRRHLVLLGALANRAIFEVCEVSKKADAVV